MQPWSGLMLLPGSTLFVIAIAITAASGCNSAQRPDSTGIERFAVSRIQMVERDIEDPRGRRPTGAFSHAD